MNGSFYGFSDMKNTVIRRGFTLIELSIVLIIIGLLAGGVLVGQDLIEAAKNRNVIKGHEEFKTMWYTFRDKYRCIPGDCKKATKLWGVDLELCSTHTPGTVSSDGSCNGDGDGKIAWSSPGYEGASFIMNHLAFADIGNIQLVERDTNTPITNKQAQYAQHPDHKNGKWFVGANNTNYAALYPNNSVAPTMTMSGNALQSALVYDRAASGYPPSAAIISPARLYAIDIKSDDGDPIGGVLQANNGLDPDDTTTPTYLDCLDNGGGSWEYQPTVTQSRCRYIFKLD